MASIEETLPAMRRKMRHLLETAMEGVLTKARGVLEKAERKREKAERKRTKVLREVEEERVKGLAEVAEERAEGLAAIDARWAELHREVATMHKHKEAQEGRVELNIGGCHFHTSVQALRRVPHTSFDANFSGRYAQDVCKDGSIFVDRDGEHFGHVLEYMRDRTMSASEPRARPSVSLLRALKREFGFYCIELCAEPEPVQLEMAYVMGGHGDDGDADHYDTYFSSMERYDVSSGQWHAMAAMDTARHSIGACVIAGEIYVTGGRDYNNNGRVVLASVEKYSPSSDTWSAVTPLPKPRSEHTAVAVGSDMYVIGGFIYGDPTKSVLKFDSAQGTWSEVALTPDGLRSFAAYEIDSDIYVFGGVFGGQQQSVLRFDTLTNTWSNLMRPFSAHITVRTCWAAWFTSWGLAMRVLDSFDSTQPRKPGARSLPHRSKKMTVGPSCWMAACTLWEMLRIIVWSATTSPATHGRRWQTCRSSDGSAVPSPSDLRARSKSRTSSTRLSPRPPRIALDQSRDSF
jgi:N-acetylneuraminic acid mutarotase